MGVVAGGTVGVVLEGAIGAGSVGVRINSERSSAFSFAHRCVFE